MTTGFVTSTGSWVRFVAVRDRLRAVTLCAVSVAVLWAGALLAPVPAFAQDTGLSQELERLRRDVRDLQRTVFAGAAPPPSSAGSVADTVEDSQAAARLRLQLQELERELTNLTGRMEEIGFQVQQMNTRIDKLVSDVDFRLNALEGNGVSGAPQALSQTPGSAASATTIVSGQGASGPAGESLANGQQLLGQLPASALSGEEGAERASALQPTIGPGRVQQAAPTPSAPQAAPAPQPVQSAAGATQTASISLPDGDDQAQYQYAYGLLRQDLGQAEQAFKQFLDQNGSSPYAGNAMYWLGETHYARSDFRQAAAVFVDAYTNYPESPKASASLLKLGMSLGALGKTEAACASFGELKTRFPDADPRVLDRAGTEAGKIGCP